MITLRTLIVDDEPGMRLSVARVLRNHSVYLHDIDVEVSFEVDMAENGKEAMDKLTMMHPDIVLLDYKLPDMTGMDILHSITANETEMRVIMITAYASLETAVTAIKEGAFDFLAKPFTPIELKKVVDKATHHLLLARQVKQLAEEKRQVRFQFISVLGHELKSPLNAIEGYLNLMQAHTAGDNLADYDAMVDRSLVRIQGMRKMIADLLDLTRIESGQKKRELSKQDIADVINLSIEASQALAAERGIRIQLSTQGSCEMMCDPSEIEMIMNNLITNAVKYNKDNGEVNIRVRREEPYLVIEVQDTGIGLSKEDLDKLFKEFVRIKNAKTRNILGSGLGLTILDKLTKLYQGSISVQSVPDQGSTFTIKLKINSEEEVSEKIED